MYRNLPLDFLVIEGEVTMAPMLRLHPLAKKSLTTEYNLLNLSPNYEKSRSTISKAVLGFY